MMYRALPSQAYLLSVLRYEPETGELFWKEREPSMFEDGAHCAEHTCRWWNNRFAGQEAFTTMAPKGYLTGRLVGRMWLAQRIIWKMVYGADPIEVDHENGLKNDNRLLNLRDEGRDGNRRNLPLPKNNRSGVMGVWWNSQQGKWQARIRSRGITKHLGCFDLFDEAASARKAAEREFGFHANHGRSRSAA